MAPQVTKTRDSFGACRLSSSEGSQFHLESGHQLAGKERASICGDSQWLAPLASSLSLPGSYCKVSQKERNQQTALKLCKLQLPVVNNQKVACRIPNVYWMEELGRECSRGYALRESKSSPSGLRKNDNKFSQQIQGLVQLWGTGEKSEMPQQRLTDSDTHRTDPNEYVPRDSDFLHDAYLRRRGVMSYGDRPEKLEKLPEIVRSDIWLHQRIRADFFEDVLPEWSSMPLTPRINLPRI